MNKHEHIFDIWDSKAQRLYKRLDQYSLSQHAELLARDDCYLIHHIGMKAYNGRDIRHGDLVRKLNDKEVYIVAWYEARYLLRNKRGYKDFYNSEVYEVLSNRMEQT